MPVAEIHQRAPPRLRHGHLINVIMKNGVSARTWK
jgi:hypothetical protein